MSERARGPRRGRRDLLLALALAVLMSGCWAINDWPSLSQLILPDTDDVMRLVQVRDWIAGQATNDWTQYRVAPPLGAPMHWSRVNDAGIAALILLGRLFASRHAAEVAAVVAYPAILFAAHLWLVGAIARRVWGTSAAPPVAMLLGALAYPGVTAFAPGRIDHHALQVVLIEGAVLAATMRAGWRSGGAMGAAIALSLVIGLEALLHGAALIAVAGAGWIVRGDADERDRLLGLAGGLALTTLPFVLLLRPTLWSRDLCDAFTPASTSVVFGGAAVLVVLATATRRLRDWRARAVVAAALGIVLAVGIARSFPACLTGPYGRVDPFLRREFIAHVGEALGVFAQPDPVQWLQWGGLMAVAAAAASWAAWRDPAGWRRWGPIAAVVLVSAALTVAQVRGTYLGTPIAAALLAGVVLGARRRGGVALVAAWLLCAGTAWQLLATGVHAAVAAASPSYARASAAAAGQETCNTLATWAALRTYPTGVVMTATNLAPYLLEQTRHATVAAGYHRNNAGNLAMYRFFLSPPPAAGAIARRWRVDYVAYCPGDFGEIDALHRYPGSIAAALTRGQVPAGWRPLPMPRSRLRVYRITA